MSIQPTISFKAGICEMDKSARPYKIRPRTVPGYIFLYPEDELIHFCWRPRDTPVEEAPLDLVMVPGDSRFVPYEVDDDHASAKTNGRIFALKFASSSQRQLFWLQSKSQSPDGDPAWISPRDRKIGEIVDQLLQGYEPDIDRELAEFRDNHAGRRGSRRDGDDDETMDDVEGHGDDSGHPHGGAGGAGSGATGGDVRDEGEEAREGGADGARAASAAAPEAAAAVRNFLASLSGQPGLSSGGQSQEKAYPLLNDLLETSVTVPTVRNASDEYLDGLLSYLPPTVLILSQPDSAAATGDLVEPTAEAVAAAKAAMTTAEKKSLLEKVLRSPQFSQSLASLSMAIRDGGLPSIADALGIPVQNKGFLPGGAMPMGGGEAVEAFVEGVKTAVEKKLDEQNP